MCGGITVSVYKTFGQHGLWAILGGLWFGQGDKVRFGSVFWTLSDGGNGAIGGMSDRLGVI